MRTFIVIFLVLHIPLFVYPVLRLCQWLELSPLVTALILLPIVFSQVISRWMLRGARHLLVRKLRQVADFILGMSPIAVMALLLAEVIVALALISPRTAALAAIAVTVAVSLLGLLAALRPMVRTIGFDGRNLARPLRVAQITDVHIGSRSSRFLETVVSKVRDLDPDLLCITGDFIDAWGVEESELASLRELACPVYFSIGNHERYEDLGDILQRLENLGVIVLRNRSVMHRDDVQVIGIDDRDDALQVERELGRIEVADDAFSLLLYHRPRGLTAASAAGIGLMLSGHTHNGQIFPFNLVVRNVFDKIAGLHELDQTRLYVSQGTGTWGPVMRVGTRSEITLFELECVK